MKKTTLEIYALTVCFFTVACFVITLGMALWNIVQFSAPEFTVSAYQYSCHQSDSAYKECYSSAHQYTRDHNPLTFPSEQALTDQRLNAYQQLLQTEQREALQGLAQKLIILLIDMLVFLGHWILAGRARG